MPGSASQRIRRSKAEQRAESVEQILDAAEYLFSMHGLHGVTLRDVAEHVGIHTTLVHYYFDDKRSLFDAVFARRAVVISDLQMAALEKYAADAGANPTVEGALHAFLDTDLDLYPELGANWMNYAAFCARVSNTPEGAALMAVHFDPVVLTLVGILRRALPTYSDEDIFWGYHFVTGALMNTLARTGRIDRLSGGLCRSDDFPAVRRRIATFMAAGFHALRDASPTTRAAPAATAAKTDDATAATARKSVPRERMPSPATPTGRGSGRRTTRS